MLDQSPEQLARQFALLLLGAALVGMLARRVGVPYAVALVVGGLLIEESHITSVPTLDPGLVLSVSSHRCCSTQHSDSTPARRAPSCGQFCCLPCPERC